MKTRASFDEFLREAIADSGNKSLAQLAEFAKDEDETFLKSPAIGALICWGEPGLKAIRQIALDNPTSKNISAALKALSTVASGVLLPASLLFIQDEELIRSINQRLETRTLQSAGRRELAELVLSLSEDDLLIPLGTAFSQLSFGGQDLTSELVAALSSKWLGFGPPVLQRYEGLLLNAPDNEQVFQKFFIEFPHLLDPAVVHMWSEPDFHGAFAPDFLIRRADDTYLIVEIEKPSKNLITAGGQLTTEATHAEKQVIEYKNFLNERILEVRSHFPNYREPDCLVVIGLERSLMPAKRNALRQINDSRQRIRIVGFDWLLDRANVVLGNVTSGKVTVETGFRVI
ncbi:Shedu anti-phage system protein SduA domain-containing protein [Dongia sedimenti]|uniref:DUF4263 domain-containing protein n=1 Tax=Dongia sedimenti TaxID=3064282 RepID=A0ABU0YMC4_9PROT|nr:DUF4263 domain-containing protein [Rhodospirillaceae bacterium R-7]